MDLRPLLRTNAAPTEVEECFLLEKISSLDGTLSKLDLELASAQRTLDALTLRHYQLKEKRDTFANIISPLRRLPDDVWIEIMKFTVWSTTVPVPPSTSDASAIAPSHQHPSAGSTTIEHQPFPSSPDPSHPGDGASTPATEPPPHLHWPEAKQLSTLTRVCRAWHALLTTAAVFWSALDLHIYANDRGLDAFAPRLEAWFLRAGDLPWALRLHSSKRQLRAPAFAGFLVRYCNRWRQVRVCMQDLDVLAPLFRAEAQLVWTNLEELALDGWFTDGAKVRPFNVGVDGGDEEKVGVVGRSGSMPALTSLSLDLPCQKIANWAWIPWERLVDVDLKTADTYEDNVAILARCSETLKTCSLVFTPSLRLPVGIPLGPTEPVAQTATALFNNASELTSNTSHSSTDDADTTPKFIHLTTLKELVLKNISYLSPLLSRLCVPALEKLLITMSTLNDPEPFLGTALIDLLDRSSSYASGSPHPLDYLTLVLDNTRRRRPTAPVISNAEYLRLFERTEGLRTLHVKDYSTDARFLERLNERGLLPRLRTVSFVVCAGDRVPGRFEEFVRRRLEVNKRRVEGKVEKVDKGVQGM